jgi:hypothetical protein
MGNSSSTQSGKDAGAKVDAAINKASSKTEKVGAKQVHARRDERRQQFDLQSHLLCRDSR